MQITDRAGALAARQNYKAWERAQVLPEAERLAAQASALTLTADLLPEDSGLRAATMDAAYSLRNFARRLGCAEDLLSDLAPADIEGWRARVLRQIAAQADQLIYTRASHEQQMRAQARYFELIRKLCFWYENGRAAELDLTADEKTERAAIEDMQNYGRAVLAHADGLRAQATACADVETLRALDLAAGWPGG